jgi:hypothetical protein
MKMSSLGILQLPISTFGLDITISQAWDGTGLIIAANSILIGNVMPI